MNIIDFLLKRIEEDEARANYYGLALGTDRILAECAAKRAIIGLWDDPNGIDALTSGFDVGYMIGFDAAVKALAAVYKDHPDYQEEWAA